MTKSLKTLLTQIINSIPRVGELTAASTLTLSSSGFVLVGTIASGHTIISVMVSYYGSATGAFSLTMGSNNRLYLTGTPNVTVTDLKVRYLYL